MALDRFYNQDEVLSKQAAIGQIFDNQDQGTLDANQIRVPLSCLLYTSPSPRDLSTSRMPSSA